MELKSEIMEELWKIKEELSSGYKSFHDYFQDLLKYQAEHHPEFSSQHVEGTAAIDFHFHISNQTMKGRKEN